MGGLEGQAEFHLQKGMSYSLGNGHSDVFVEEQLTQQDGQDRLQDRVRQDDRVRQERWAEATQCRPRMSFQGG